MVEGFASDGSRQLYVLVGGTRYLVDWDAATVSIAFTSLDDVAGATAGRAAYVAMTQENPLQFYQGDIILNEGTGSILRITPTFEVAQIGTIKDDGFDTTDHEAILCIQTVRDFLIA